MNIVDKREIIIRDSYDVVVVGGGIAGVAAAVAAARSGAKTLIIEKTVAFGGLATIGLISWYEPLCDCHGKKMQGGIPEELLKLSIEYGFDTLSDKWKNGNTPNMGDTECYATFYSPSIFMLALDKFLEDNGVAIRVDSLATFPVMEGNICRGVVVESESGKEFFGAKVVIDATGDAGVMKDAGVPCVVGENFFSSLAQGFTYERAERYVNEKDANAMSMWIHAGSDLFGNGQCGGKMYNGTDAEEVTEFLLKTRRATFDKIKDEDRNSRDISRLPMMPTFRTIRRIVGEYEFSGNDENVRFEDSVGSCGDFRQKGPDCRPKHFHIPYSCMYNKNFDNMLAAGRIISCDRDGWEITRVIPVAALTGEAAGTAAAIAVKDDKAVYDIDIKKLQQTLKSNGVLFEE